LYILAATVCAGAMAWLGLTEFQWNDYGSEAAPSVHELLTGHIGGFFLHAPAYGGSLLIRAPFAFAANLWGGGELADYRMLALPCLLAVCGLGLWLCDRMRARGSSALARVALIGVLLANPCVLYALEIGHPEELLAAVLCVAAMLAAISRRAVLAGVMIGLALATKSWGLIALPAVILTLPGGRLRALLSAIGTATAVLAPFLILQRLHSTGGPGITDSSSGIIFWPQQLWWFLGDPHTIVRTAGGQVLVGFRAAPGWLSPVIHPLIVFLGVPLALLWSVRRRGRAGEPLALLALLMLLRCALDPWDSFYYALPFLFALASWEVTEHNRAPLLALAATALEWLCFRELASHVSPDAQAAAYVCWTLPGALAIACWLYLPDSATRLARRAAGVLGASRHPDALPEGAPTGVSALS
jgi:hypothetical protein